MLHATPQQFQSADIIALPMHTRLPDTDPVQALSRLRRPRKLLEAARLGQSHYRRARDLRRLLRLPVTPAPRQGLILLLAEEARLNDMRLEDGADYGVARHLEVLIACLAEGAALAAL